MDKNIINLTNDNFDDVIIGSNKTIVIDFWAVWCGPCKMLAPIFEELSNEMDNVIFCKVNVDEQPELAAAFKISSIPTVVFVKDRTIVDQSVGYVTKEQLKAIIEKNV